ncbi:MAG: hypothetical protein ABIZ80_24500, partial [Bryobacteraceae bacterium]
QSSSKLLPRPRRCLFDMDMDVHAPPAMLFLVNTVAQHDPVTDRDLYRRSGQISPRGFSRSFPAA